MIHHCPGAQEEVTCNPAALRELQVRDPNDVTLQRTRKALKEEAYLPSLLLTPPVFILMEMQRSRQIENEMSTSGLSTGVGSQGRSPEFLPLERDKSNSLRFGLEKNLISKLRFCF